MSLILTLIFVIFILGPILKSIQYGPEGSEVRQKNDERLAAKTELQANIIKGIFPFLDPNKTIDRTPIDWKKKNMIFEEGVKANKALTAIKKAAEIGIPPNEEDLMLWREYEANRKAGKYIY
jgi:hypothetical protein